MQYSCCLIYHQKRYTPYHLMAIGSKFVHLHLHQVKFDLCRPYRHMMNEKELILRSLNIDFQLDQCSEISYMSLLGFLSGTDTTSQFSCLSGFLWYSIPTYPSLSLLQSLLGSISVHKYNTGPYSYLLYPADDWQIPMMGLQRVLFNIQVLCVINCFCISSLDLRCQVSGKYILAASVRCQREILQLFGSVRC